MVMVTQAWRQSDNARSFVRALEAMGYVLATGKRPYVLVDMYGMMNALPKMIDDRSVRTNDIRAFLERDFPAEQLPRVEEARALAADLRKAREQFAKAQGQAEAVARLEAMQQRRRAELLAAQEQQRTRHRQERAELERERLAARRAQKAGYLAQVKAVRAARLEARPRGLAAFLGRVTGVSLVIGKLHRHRDARAWRAFAADRQALALAQKQAALSLQRRQEVQGLDAARQLKALGKVEVRERQALEVRRVREQRIIGRSGHDRMPSLTLELKPKGRSASVRRAKDRYRDRSGSEEREEGRGRRSPRGKTRYAEKGTRPAAGVAGRGPARGALEQASRSCRGFCARSG
ncbi:MAG: hypothetical protein EPN45_17720 [Rhizobiaceae bacterium]|nr:MAG: hypothetical protein EPN45_17720 [Rhizobiaceae bacterium]